MRLLFVTTPGTISSALIRAFEGGLASHCGIVIGDMVIDATFKHGVSMWSVDKFLTNHKLVDDVTFSVPDESIGAWYAHKQLGKRYDWTALAGFLAWRDWSEDDSWYCSELSMACAATAGKTLADRHNRIGVRLLHEVARAWAATTKPAASACH